MCCYLLCPPPRHCPYVFRIPLGFRVGMLLKLLEVLKVYYFGGIYSVLLRKSELTPVL